MTEFPVAAELLIPATCRGASQSYQGFVLRLGRDHAYFAARGEGPGVGATLVLTLELPWRLGSLTLAARTAAPATPARLPGICLDFEDPSPQDRRCIERYLARFHHLVAELQR